MGDLVRVVRRGRFIGWYVRYKDSDGRRKMRASHQPTQALARRYLIEVEARVARGLIGIPELAPPAPTLAQLVERFIVEYSRPRIRDLSRYRITARTALRRALPFVGEVRVDAITAIEMLRLRDTLCQRLAANSARATLSHLQTLFSWAEKLGLVAQNPLRTVELPSRQALIEYLSREEIAALLSTAERRAARALIDRLLQVCVLLALHTGLRKGELFGLRWSDLDLRTRRLNVARSFDALPKGGKPRHLRLPDSVMPILEAWQRECPRNKDNLVFPAQRRKIWSMVAHSGEMLGLPELIAEANCRPLRRPWHALRHSFASHYIMSGGNILALQKILGHADIKMTLVYAHLAPDFLAEEMNRLKFC